LGRPISIRYTNFNSLRRQSQIITSDQA